MFSASHIGRYSNFGPYGGLGVFHHNDRQRGFKPFKKNSKGWPVQLPGDRFVVAGNGGYTQSNYLAGFQEIAGKLDAMGHNIRHFIQPYFSPIVGGLSYPSGRFGAGAFDMFAGSMNFTFADVFPYMDREQERFRQEIGFYEGDPFGSMSTSSDYTKA